MSAQNEIALPEDVKQRFPSLRYWQVKLKKTVESMQEATTGELQTKIADIEASLENLNVTIDEIIQELANMSTQIESGGIVQDNSIAYGQINIGAGTEINWSAGRVFYVELLAATSFTFTGLIPGKQILVIVKQDSSTAYACTWPADVLWTGGVEPDLTAVTTGSTNVFSFVCYQKSDLDTAVVGTALTDAT